MRWPNHTGPFLLLARTGGCSVACFCKRIQGELSTDTRNAQNEQPCFAASQQISQSHAREMGPGLCTAAPPPPPGYSTQFRFPFFDTTHRLRRRREQASSWLWLFACGRPWRSWQSSHQEAGLDICLAAMATVVGRVFSRHCCRLFLTAAAASAAPATQCQRASHYAPPAATPVTPSLLPRPLSLPPASLPPPNYRPSAGRPQCCAQWFSLTSSPWARVWVVPAIPNSRCARCLACSRSGCSILLAPCLCMLRIFLPTERVPHFSLATVHPHAAHTVLACRIQYCSGAGILLQLRTPILTIRKEGERERTVVYSVLCQPLARRRALSHAPPFLAPLCHIRPCLF